MRRRSFHFMPHKDQRGPESGSGSTGQRDWDYSNLDGGRSVTHDDAKGRAEVTP